MNKQSKPKEILDTTYVILKDCPGEVHLKIKAFQVQQEMTGKRLTIPEAYYDFILKAKI